MTDRHLVASSDAFLKAMSITEQLICHADFWMKHAFSPELNDHFSFETLFYRTYVILGLIVKQFDLTMFTVRAPGDTTSLSKGEKYDLFETRFGFLVKYPTELIAAIGYCGVLNLTEHISHMRLE